MKVSTTVLDTINQPALGTLNSGPLVLAASARLVSNDNPQLPRHIISLFLFQVSFLASPM